MTGKPSNYGPRNPAMAMQGFQWNVATKAPATVTLYQQAQDARRAGRLQESEQSLRALLATDGEHTDALHTLGIVRHQLGDSKEAEVLIRRAITLRAEAQYLDNLGNLLWELKRLDEAEVCYRQAILLKPDYANAYVNLATILKLCQRYDTALSCFAQALTLSPQRPDILCNLGFLHYRAHRWHVALKLYRQALVLQPDYVDACLNLSAVLRDLHHLPEALSLCEHALMMSPQRVEARLNRAILLLQLGRFEEGWREYEYRWQLGDAETHPITDAKPWLGAEDVRGKSLLLYAEQGHGDTLQFVRYASMVAARGARVYLLVQRALKSLLTSCAGVQQVFAYGEELPQFDYRCPLMSLPLAFDTRVVSIPANPPYLAARAEKIATWQQRLGAKAGLRVGLVWAGERRQHTESAQDLDDQRSLHFEQIHSLLDVPGTQFYNLQIANRAREQIAGEPRIIDFSAEINDFEDTAALIQHLDLVISVDTSVAHLAGAVGKPVWLLDRYSHCWRWLTDREDSPWYPRMRIFRQASQGDWAGVMVRARQALIALTAEDWLL